MADTGTDTGTVRWTPPAAEPEQQLPPLPVAILRGLRCRCPVCGQGRVFSGYLTVVPFCATCGAPLGRARADDAPPYFTIFVVGHVVVLGMLSLEQKAHPPLWVHAAIWLPLTLLLSLALLRPFKGATVGLTLKFGLLKPEDDE
jgi:uncharacterized protein (DUF983 family)